MPGDRDRQHHKLAVVGVEARPAVVERLRATATAPLDGRTRTVIRVRKTETLSGMAELILRAVEKTSYGTTTPRGFYEELARNIGADWLGLFAGYLDGDPRAFSVVALPTSAFMAGPQVPLAYSENRVLSRLVGGTVAAWLRRAGHDRYFAVNFKNDDLAWQRVFAHAGDISSCGTIFEIKVK